jgi:hypothetical protein
MMEKEKLESMLIDYIDGRLDDADRTKVEYELLHNVEAQKIYKQLKTVFTVIEEVPDLEPSEKVASEFNAFLKNEIQNERRTKLITITPWYYKVAAAIALTIVGAGVGYWISQQQSKDDELIAMKRELELTKQLVMSKLNDEQSASQRMLGVQAAYEVETSDMEITRALIKVMNEDPNSNVRLSAIKALAQFPEEEVKKALIASLSVQTDPVVQIALIQLMVQMKEKGAVKSLQQIIDDEKTLPAVKDEAYASIFKLT